MVLDLGLLERSMAEVHKTLDHKLLNKVEALGPPTLENLSRFIWEQLQHAGQHHPRQRASRQLQRELQLFRAAGLGYFTVIASEAKQSTVAQQEAGLLRRYRSSQ